MIRLVTQHCLQIIDNPPTRCEDRIVPGCPKFWVGSFVRMCLRIGLHMRIMLAPLLGTASASDSA